MMLYQSKQEYYESPIHIDQISTSSIPTYTRVRSRRPVIFDGHYSDMRGHSRTIFGLRMRDLQLMTGLLLLAVFIRLYRIYQPSSVVFDEVHFGGFASKYMKGRFFMDVHPPLAKLLITFAGLMGGFDGNFDFKEIGKDYIEPRVPYVPMRLMPATLGVLVIPMAYLTLRQSHISTTASVLVSILLILENGLITQSRLILLDSPLVACTALTVLAWSCFQSEQRRPFGFWWWFWMSMTGLALGLTVSCKWVGLFTIALVGVSTIRGLWDMLGDLRITPEIFTKHFLARVLCLIVIPISVYMFFFAIHFAILTNSGDGDGFMSAEFQQSLKGHQMHDVPIDIAYGSHITIRHVNTQGGYLHSHNHVYPSGSRQQQVTLYPHKDENNVWKIMNRTNIPYDGPPVMVKNGDVVRLEHVATSKKLHSHDIRPPLTELDYHNEVSAYGFAGFEGDDNDLWRVEITEHSSSDPKSKDYLRTLHSKFRLVHLMTGCHLFSHKLKLPKWGFEQQEVTCIKGGTYPKTVWTVESNKNDQLPEDAEKVNYKKLGFLGKFLELNQVMWQTNAGLTDSHPYDSRPFDWIVLKRGISFWGKHHRHIYLLGNPIVWWGGSASVAIYLIFKTLLYVRAKRGYKDQLSESEQFYESLAGFFLVGWFLHWAPFFLMSRQLFLHHYFPALYFSVLLFGVLFDIITKFFKSRHRVLVALCIILVTYLAFRTFAPLAYGDPWTKSDCKKAKWLSSWDFDCNQFYDNYDEFNTEPTESPDTKVDHVSSNVPHGKENVATTMGEVAHKADAKNVVKEKATNNNVTEMDTEKKEFDIGDEDDADDEQFNPPAKHDEG
ncbi:2149_t:CDS:10 [Paraglomus occultum]|uniref:Dolichyl-phosphate-mannose--protein mannosyltransferase n=1 Tax=Paraglomus occultum TaxID=144539 RepID=A0A9N9B526_9GLOM|nr:2149_t:CDS:10 [Paraglomus occultum]